MTSNATVPPQVDEAFANRYRAIIQQWQAGDLTAEQAENQLLDMREEATTANQVMNQASVELNLGVIHGYVGDLIASARLFETAKQHFDAVGAEAQAVTCVLNIGEVYRLQGNFDRARMFFRRAYERGKALDNRRTMVVALTNEGQMWLSMGRIARATTCLEEALSMALEPYPDEDNERLRNQRYGVLAEIYHALTQISLSEHNQAKVWEYAVQSYNYAQKTQQPLHLGFGNRAIADAITALGVPLDSTFESKPDIYYKIALENFQKVKMEGDIAKTYFARGNSLRKRGRKSAAARLYQRALAIFTQLGMTDDAAKVAEAQMEATV